MTVATLQTELDSTESNRKVRILKLIEDTTLQHCYAIGGTDYPGKARWTTLTTADTDATKAAAILANLAL